MNGFGLKSVKVEDLRNDPELRATLRPAASKGSHPRPEIVKAIDAIEKETAQRS